MNKKTIQKTITLLGTIFVLILLFCFSQTVSSNSVPNADAGADREVFENENITLHSSSSDPDGGSLDYYWHCTGGTLSDRNNRNPVYYAPSVSSGRTFTCSLSVYDNGGAMDSDSMNVEVKDKDEDLLVKKYVKNLSRGDNQWYGSYIHADPLDVVQYKIEVESNTDELIENIKVKEQLPAGITYQDDLVFDSDSIDHDITGEALNIGDLAGGETKTITFRAMVKSSSSFNYGENNLISSSLVYNNDISKTDTVKVIVEKTGVAGVSTGITGNSIVDSLLFPLVLALLIVLVFKSQIIGFDEKLQKRKKQVAKFRAQKRLEKNIKEAKERLS